MTVKVMEETLREQGNARVLASPPSEHGSMRPTEHVDAPKGGPALACATFDSTHAAMTAQSKLSALMPRVVPTPVEIDRGCGMSLMFVGPAVEKARAEAAGDPEIAASIKWYAMAGGSYDPID